jgi:hypothetical protein
MGKVRIDYHDEGFPFPPHYAIKSTHAVRTVMGSEETESAVMLDFERLTDMLVHHMGKFEKGGGDLEIDGFKVPMKAAARIYIDAICTIVGNHGVSVNLAKIRDELCSTCIGSPGAAKEFIENQDMKPKGVTHEQ